MNAPPYPLHGCMFAFDRDFHQKQGSNIKITDALFNLVPNQIIVPTEAIILTQLSDDPTLEILVPYQAGDQGTAILRANAVIPAPFTYVNVFIATDVTPAYLFNHIYPQMENDKVEDQCQSFR